MSSLSQEKLVIFVDLVVVVVVVVGVVVVVVGGGGGVVVVVLVVVVVVVVVVVERNLPLVTRSGRQAIVAFDKENIIKHCENHRGARFL